MSVDGTRLPIDRMRRTSLLHQIDELSAFGLIQASTQARVKLRNGAIHLLQEFITIRRERDVPNAPVSGASVARDEPLGLQLVDQAGDGRDHRDQSVRDLQTRQRLAFTSEDAQYVVLRLVQPIVAKKLAEAVLEQVVGPQQSDDDGLLNGIKCPLFPEFLFKLSCHCERLRLRLYHPAI